MPGLNIIYAIYYFLLMISHVYVCYVTFTHPHAEKSLLVQFSFITRLSFYYNWLYYFIRLYQVIFGIKNKKYSAYLKSYFQLSFDVSFLVAVLFWGLVCVNRDLVVPRHHQMLTFVNLFKHGGNFLVNLIEHMIIKPRKKIRRVPIKYIIAYGLGYFTYIHILWSFFGIVIYPLIKGSIFVRGIAAFSGVMLLLIGDFIYMYVPQIKKNKIEENVKNNNNKKKEKKLL